VDASNPEVRDFLSKSAHPERFHLLGVRSDMENVYPAFTIFTLCSAFGEGFPLTLGEAMASGLPCVATDVGDSAEIIAGTGRITRARDASGIASAWIELLSLPEEALASLARQARQRVIHHYALSETIESYARLYRSLDVSPERAGGSDRSGFGIESEGEALPHMDTYSK
jgi:glycosyltransferase involved in cell wall biosynthesis